MKLYHAGRLLDMGSDVASRLTELGVIEYEGNGFNVLTAKYALRGLDHLIVHDGAVFGLAPAGDKHLSRWTRAQLMAAIQDYQEFAGEVEAAANDNTLSPALVHGLIDKHIFKK